MRKFASGKDDGKMHLILQKASLRPSCHLSVDCEKRTFDCSVSDMIMRRL